MQILDRLLPESFQNDLINLFYQAQFPWYYHASTTAVTEAQLLLPSPNSFTDANTVERPQFSHSFAVNGKITSDYYNTIFPILYFLEARTGYSPSQVRRIKANMLTKDATYPENSYHEPHTDVYGGEGVDQLSSMIYYIDDADGDTYFFNEQLTADHTPDTFTVAHRQTPKRGTGIFFPSNQFHASSSPKRYNRRVILNFVLAN
jgi:hypothetical protein